MQLMNGPLNKSLYTQTLELVTKCLLHAPQKIVMYTDGIDETSKKSLHVGIDNIDIDLSALMKRANFSHIELSQADSDQYLKAHPYYHHQDHDMSNEYRGFDYGFYSPRNHALPADSTPLNAGERFAIINYTGSGYQPINALLKDAPQSDYYWGGSLKTVVANALMLASGLNKIMPSVDLHAFPSFRGESSPTDTQIAQRIELVKQGGGIIHEPAYSSTSDDHNVANGFASKSIIIFDSVYGKSISMLSNFPFESEFLLPPGEILWESYERKEKVIEYPGEQPYTQVIHEFHAKVVAPLIEGKDDHSATELKQFADLLDWAGQHGIETDFVTPCLKQQVNNLSSNNHHAIEMQGVISDFQGLDLNNHSQPLAPIMTLTDLHPCLALNQPVHDLNIV
jgi:hypothetical protein